MGKEDEDEEKRKKKERKERRKDRKAKRGEKVNQLNSLDKSQEDNNVWKDSKIDKNRKGRKSVTFSDSYPFDQAYKDDCVADVLKLLFARLEEHVADKPFYPKYVAHAVSRTVAQMVQMVCYSQVYWMDNCLAQPGGGRAEEWKTEEEIELPPIDTWARAVIPMKQSSVPVTFFKPLRSAAGQFKQFPPLDVDRVIEIPRRPGYRRASETTILAQKLYRKSPAVSMGEARRRNSDSLDAKDLQRKKLGKRVDLSSLLLDQAFLNKILKAKGLLPPPKPKPFEVHLPKPPYFENY
ncbi:unnamed protein product [Calypogeia fissa]